jgi:DNA-binding transcriptional LysR family regulator
MSAAPPRAVPVRSRAARPTSAQPVAASAPPADRGSDLRQLRYFVTVAEELNFRRAAERLHVTQPPLSRQIAALEAALGVALLERDTRQTRLTAAGAVAQREFTRLLAEFDAAAARVSASAPQARDRIRIGALWWNDLSRFGPFVRALRQVSGLAEIEPQLGHSTELLQRVAAGTLDAALVVLPLDVRGLEVLPVAQVRHVAMVPASSPLARRRALRLAELALLPAFLRFRRRENPALWDHLQRQYQAAGFQPARERPAPGTSETVAQIAAGRGGTVMPEAFARQKYPGVVARRLLDPVTIDVALVLAPGLEAPLRKALAATARRLAPLLQ